tara:strand:+ start:147 stop:1418 length:1272 start_codon:yes stop_codon:yes gene_type:complete
MKKQDLINLTKKTHKASQILSNFSTEDKNKLLKLIHININKNKNNILENNQIDVQNSKDMKKDFAFIDRLTLTEHKIELMLNGIENIISLNDPVGKIIEDKILDNEMNLKKITVPLGVIGVIYESRPDITTDISSLCIKSGNAVILKGGKESINTNICLTTIIKQSLKEFGTDDNFVNLIESTDRKITKEFLQLNEYIDLMIPRGGESLVKMVGKEAKMPSITGGIGVTHIYIDHSADIDKAISVVLNSKVSKPSVCNALDTLLIHSKILPTFLPLVIKSLSESNVEIRCDSKSYNEIKKYNYNKVLKSSKSDWGKEFLDLILSIKCVYSIEEAISHIYDHGSGHTDGIISESKNSIKTFVNNIDSAAIMVNASTQFNDGGEFGLGAEVAISTNKYGARGPMGLENLCSYKWILTGKGNIRIR